MIKIRLACMMGTAFEFFEFQMFALLLPFLVHDIFNPAAHELNGWLQGYLAFGVAFLARPLGGLLLGHIGDHYGRRKSLLAAMWLMTISTMLIGLLPGYQTLGVVSCLLLFLCRIGQGLSLGGEFACGSVFLFEHQATPSCYSLIWQDIGGTIGLLLATLTVASVTFFISPAAMQTIGWRIPFLAALLLGVVSVYIRSALSNPDSHAALLNKNDSRTRKDYYREVKSRWRMMVPLIFACAPNGIFWYLQVMVIPNHLLHLTPVAMLMLTSLTLCAIPFGAKLADRFGAYHVWIFSVIALMLNFGLFILPAHHTMQLVGVTLQAVLLAVNQGPRLFILNNSFPLAVRVISCSFIYSMANVLGGMTPYVALSLLEKPHGMMALYQMISLFSLLAIGAMWLVHPNSRVAMGSIKKPG